MKIKKLNIKNYLGIEEVSTSPSEQGLAISGDNRKGKTSILDAIIQAVANENPRQKIIRDDSQPARIYIEMDDGLKIERTFTPAGGKYITVEKDGMRSRGPETFLKALLGPRMLMFDPVEFVSKSERELSEMILSLIPISVSEKDVQEWIGTVPLVNFNQHGLQICKDIGRCLYEKRTGINREVNTLKTEMETIVKKLPEGYNPEKWRNVNLNNKFKAIQEGMKLNQARKEAETIISSHDTDIQNIKNAQTIKLANNKARLDSEKESIKLQIQELEKRIAVLKDKLLRIEDEYKEMEKIFMSVELSELIKAREEKTEKAKEFLQNNPEIDIQSLQEEATVAEQMKNFIPLYDNLERVKAEYNEKSKHAAELTRQLEIIRNKPFELLSKVKMPVQGLSIDNEGNVLINNLPIKNLSTSEIIELICDIEIAKSSDIQFVCIDRWESLGKNMQETLLKKFKDANIQVFFTEVTTGDLTVKPI